MQLAGKFIPVAEITSASQISDINTNNHKPEQEMFINISTKTLIKKLFQDGDISPYHQLKNFYFLKCFTLLFVYFVQKHSLTGFKNLLCLNNSVSTLF